MSSGLRIWDASGNLTIDTSTRMGRVLGYTDVTGSGSLSNDGFATGTPFGIVTPNSATPTGFYALPTVSFSGTTMSWTYPSGAGLGTATIIYGVY